jgi:hypothetical protein
MKKEKNYTVTIDVQVSKENEPGAKRWYSLKMYGHPITEDKEPIKFDLSNMRDEQMLKVGKKLLDAIWEIVEKKDRMFWRE